MDIFKNIGLGIIHGMWDSIRGMTLLLHIDDEMHRLNLADLEAKNVHKKRSPSPVPSSASAMKREEQLSRLLQTEVDERHLNSIKSIRGDSKPKAEKKIAKQVLKCCLLNGGFTWASIILFEQVLLPIIRMLLTIFYGENSNELHMLWGWLHSILSIIFGMMWVLPIFLLSKIVSSLWFADIANAAYRVRKGRPQMMSNISKLIADFLFSFLVQALFLVQSMLLNFLPLNYLGQSLCFLHLALLYSLYCFEYKWYNMGWELHRRLSYIENNWPYFLGFGLPLTVLTNMTNSIIVSCIFSIFFPLFILSGNEAKPLVGTTDTPLRLFSPVVFISNLLFSRPIRSNTSEQMSINAANNTAIKDAQQHLLLQQKQQQRMLQQQLMEHQLLQKEKYLQDKEPQQQRYRQPPPLRLPRDSMDSGLGSRNVTPDRSLGRNNRYAGLRPLVPTPVPGAPTSVTGAHKR